MPERTDMHAADLRGIAWRTSSFTANDSNCVEVGMGGSAPVIGVRDTKDRRAAPAYVSCAAWRSFISAAKGGAFDVPAAG
ncbi:DUF397 domain-containing protein [Streptomyces sp. RFCAC02]|uniref:DUF397 domain-containing protein n=1 Tax=Streptomyces sp. RFCAC02 TaxID=2499143 RepID=UPI0019D238B2|nr:DUF397 domain-containing protein [Streptomyces sp. RFCAC02]